MFSVRWLKVSITCERWNASCRILLTMSRSTGSWAITTPLAARHNTKAQRLNITVPVAPGGRGRIGTNVAGGGRGSAGRW